MEWPLVSLCTRSLDGAGLICLGQHEDTSSSGDTKKWWCAGKDRAQENCKLASINENNESFKKLQKKWALLKVLRAKKHNSCSWAMRSINRDLYGAFNRIHQANMSNFTMVPASNALSLISLLYIIVSPEERVSKKASVVCPGFVQTERSSVKILVEIPEFWKMAEWILGKCG